MVTIDQFSDMVAGNISAWRPYKIRH